MTKDEIVREKCDNCPRKIIRLEENHNSDLCDKCIEQKQETDLKVKSWHGHHIDIDVRGFHVCHEVEEVENGGYGDESGGADFIALIDSHREELRLGQGYNGTRGCYTYPDYFLRKENVTFELSRYEYWQIRKLVHQLKACKNAERVAYTGE